MRREFPATGPQRLYVELQSGVVSVDTTAAAPGADPDLLVLEIDGADVDRVVVDRSGDSLRVVEPRRPSGFRARWRGLNVSVTAPAGSHLATRLGSADVTGRGVLGSVSVATGSGDVTLDDVTGAAEVKTGSGDITVGSLAEGAVLKTGSGDIRSRELGGSATIATGSGDVELERTRSAVEVKTGSGDVTVRIAAQDLSLSSASGDLSVGVQTRGAARLTNVSGDIRLGVPSGTPVWTDVSSGTGHVHSDLAPVGAAAQGQDYLEVRARSVTGDIYLEER